jgi:peptidoglycan hydrolase-like protein with peptidoglycan-binding domain
MPRIGALAPPSPPPGYYKCSKAPPGGVMVTGQIQESGIVGWRYAEAVGISGGAAGKKLFKVWEITGPYQEHFWFPSELKCDGTLSAGASGKTAMVKDMQKALNTQGYSLSVDGVLGPNTCAAAYDYQANSLGLPGTSSLTGDFFVALGMPSSYAVVIGLDCKPWYAAGVGGGETVTIPSPGPSPSPEPEPYPEPEPTPVASNSKKILAAILGAVSGALLGVAVKTKWYPRKSSWAAAGAGGAAGLVGGLIVGAVALKDGGSTVAGIGQHRFRARRMGLIQANKRQPPQGLGYIPPVVQTMWDKRGSVGLIDATGTRKYW